MVPLDFAPQIYQFLLKSSGVHLWESSLVCWKIPVNVCIDECIYSKRMHLLDTLFVYMYIFFFTNTTYRYIETYPFSSMIFARKNWDFPNFNAL